MMPVADGVEAKNAQNQPMCGFGLVISPSVEFASSCDPQKILRSNTLAASEYYAWLNNTRLGENPPFGIAKATGAHQFNPNKEWGLTHPGKRLRSFDRIGKPSYCLRFSINS
jgi:hypothetical protein